MTLTLHLGVIDQPYRTAITAASRRRRKKVSAATKTTGDVAVYLEDKYHVMEHFFELHKDGIAKSLENSLAGSLETMMMGGPATLSFGTAESEIDASFKNMLSNKELDRLGYPGIPTMAALRGVNHRMLHPYARRPSRPSFIDTGLFQASFKSWIDGETP